MVIQRSWKILSDTGSNSASSTEANKSPMGGLNSSSDDSNCSNQTTHSMVTSAASPANNSVNIEALPAISFTQNQNASNQGHQNHNEATKYITTPQMAEMALQKLRQRFSNTAPLTSSSAESAMRSLELVRIAVQAQFDKEIDEMIKRFIETYFKPAFNNIKENLGQAAVNDDALQKMSCALLENAKSQYKTLRYKTQTSSNSCSVISTLPNALESNTMRMALKRPALIKPTSSVMEMQKRFVSDPQQLQQQQNQLQVLPALGTIKSTLTPNQQSVELAQNLTCQDLPLQQPAANVVSVQQPQSQHQQSHPRRQIFWNTAHISIATKFVLDVQANQAFGFGTEGKERLASKHPELIRYLPDIEDRDWLINQQIIPQQNRNSRFLFLIYDEVCRLYHSNDQYKNKVNVDLSIMMTFTVPDFLIQKMKLFFVDLNIKSRGLITNSYSMSSSTNLNPLQQSNSHLRNALLLGTTQSIPSSANATSTIPASIDSTSSPLVGSSSSPPSNITAVETLHHQKFKSSNLSSSHATLTALLNNSSSSSTSASINSTNLNDKSNNSSVSSLPNSSSSTPVVINKLRK